MTSRGRTLLVFWPVVFGISISVLRLLVLLFFGVRRLGAAELIGIALGAFGQIAFGLLLAYPLHLLQRSKARWLIHALVLVAVLLNVAAFHYEAVFWRTPGFTLLYYVQEAGHLASSAAAHAPPFAVVLEVVLTMAVLIVAAERLARREGESRRGTGAAMVVLLISAILTIALSIAPSLVSEEALAFSRVPLFWAIESWTAKQSYEAGGIRIDRQQVLEFQQMLGHRIPFGGVSERYPLCGPGPRNPEKNVANGRSVIFLVLESVGVEEMALVHQGQRVMPNLARIAANGVVFDNVKASGSKSAQAMPALFAGIPSQPAAHMLRRSPLSNVEGFPLLLRQRGYRTAYFHGGDLSFEQQRGFLRMVGFDEIVEFDVSEKRPFVGWGNADDVMFAKLQSWIEKRRAAGAEDPYLATLFTLSTHDPYILPPNRQRVFRGEDEWTRYVETLRFLDEQLASFHRWYLEHESPRGTLLVITGDHAPILARDQRPGRKDRFDVPLLILGTDRRGSEALRNRRGAQHDIPATILGLLDLSPGACDQGLDLLAPDRDWPKERILYTASGDELDQFHVWPDNSTHDRLDLVARTIRITPDPKTEEGRDQEFRRAREVFELARAMSSYLIDADAFAPPPPTVHLTRTPLPRVSDPMFVSHRGQSRGEVAPELQNKRATIEQALQDGFRRIEIDVNLTLDEEVVVLHDSVVKVGGASKPVYELTLRELRAIPGYSDVMVLEEALASFGDRTDLFVEVKQVGKMIYPNTKIALKTAEIVKAKTTRGTIVMDSFSPRIAATLEQQCGCAVGLDAPARLDRGWINNAALMGLEWIYVHFRQASPELIRYAHARGLRVLVYPVNDLGEIAGLKGEWPDAIITGRAALEKDFAQR